MEFLLEQQAQFAAESHARMSRIEKTLEETANIGRTTREELRRAVRLALQDARAERKRRKEADEKLAETDAKLAAGQEALRQSLQAFIDSMKQGRNGHDKN